MKVVVVVQQESLRERPRVHKICKVLRSLGVPFQVWKFGATRTETFDAIEIRNLMHSSWRCRPAVLRYLFWMFRVLTNGWLERRDTRFFAIGFDSAFPIALLPFRKGCLIFDNLDNVSLNYRWPNMLRHLVKRVERWLARRSTLHVVPSRARWADLDSNLRIVTNTPSREALDEARRIARDRNYSPSSQLTIYVNGWLSATRGIRQLLEALRLLESWGRTVTILVAGRPASADAERLLAWPHTENLGMLTNAEALAVYYRSHVAFTFYDPRIDINRVAESQKWTDCWATDTPFICNSEIETVSPYVAADACFAVPYDDSRALAELIHDLSYDNARLDACRRNLSAMDFAFWDEAMRILVADWIGAAAMHRAKVSAILPNR
jgi:glycosyltransferase involved in cell wall biosynthesis